MLNTSNIQALDNIVALFRCHTFAESTKKTSLLYFKSYCSCCTQINIPLVPLSDLNLARYISFLSGHLCFKSIQNYLSVINLLHKEAQIPSPINSHYIQGVLWGAKHLLGGTRHPKFPITPAILQGFFSNLNVGHSSDIIFWAVSLVAFFSFIRK
jgi:hypothetical protein